MAGPPFLNFLDPPLPYWISILPDFYIATLSNIHLQHYQITTLTDSHITMQISSLPHYQIPTLPCRFPPYHTNRLPHYHADFLLTTLQESHLHIQISSLPYKFPPNYTNSFPHSLTNMQIYLYPKFMILHYNL